MQTLISTHMVLIEEVNWYTINLQRLYISQKGISGLDLASSDAIHILV